MLEPLREEHVFAQVTLDHFGAPTWPNGADWAPDAIYKELKTKSDYRLTIPVENS